MSNKIPYKIYLDENEIPTQWYNVRADMKNKPAPLLNPGTGKPLTLEDLNPIFCEDLNKQELDNDTPYFDIPEEILAVLKFRIRDRLRKAVRPAAGCFDPCFSDAFCFLFFL